VKDTNPYWQAPLDWKFPELRFNGNSLSDVIDFLRDVAGSRPTGAVATGASTGIVVDWKALDAAGIKRTAPITLRIRDIPLREAIQLVIFSASDGKAIASLSLDDEYRDIEIKVEPVPKNP